jgi:hypothetical protein
MAVVLNEFLTPSPELSYLIGAMLGDGDRTTRKATSKHDGKRGKNGNLPCYNLIIGRGKDLVKYQKKIGFSIKRKMDKLNEGVSTIHFFEYIMPPEQELEKLNKKYTEPEIAKILHVSQSAVSKWLLNTGIRRR